MLRRPINCRIIFILFLFFSPSVVKILRVKSSIIIIIIIITIIAFSSVTTLGYQFINLLS